MNYTKHMARGRAHRLILALLTLMAGAVGHVQSQIALVSDPEHWDLDIVKQGFEPEPSPNPLLADWQDNGDLFLIGGFTNVDGVINRWFARWDGNSWRPTEEHNVSSLFKYLRAGAMAWGEGTFTNEFGVNLKRRMEFGARPDFALR